jgi:hypothetical protein
MKSLVVWFWRQDSLHPCNQLLLSLASIPQAGFTFSTCPAPSLADLVHPCMQRNREAYLTAGADLSLSPSPLSSLSLEELLPSISLSSYSRAGRFLFASPAREAQLGPVQVARRALPVGAQNST